MSAPDYTDQIEAIIVGLLRFIRTFAATTKDVALHPRRFAHKLSSGQGHYLKPFSFLTVATFSSVTITRYALIAVAIAVGTLFKDCSGQTLVPKQPPPVSEVMKLPSVETLLYVALPVVLAIILVGKVADWILLRRAASTRRGIAAIFLYVSGMQQILMIPVLGGVYFGAVRWSNEIVEHLESPWVRLLAVAVPAFMVLWPAGCFFRIGRAMDPPLDFRAVVPWRRNVLFAAVAAVAAAVSLAAIGGMAYWLAQKEIDAAAVDVPVIAVTYMERVDEDGGPPRFSVLLKNNGATDLWLKSELKMEWAGEFRCALAGDVLHAGVLKLAKGEVVPCLIHMRKRLGDIHAEGSEPDWQVKFSATDAAGEESTIVSSIHTAGSYPPLADAVIKNVP